MPNETRSDETEIAEVSQWLRELGTLPDALALPDPDRLWLLSQIGAREQAAARALRAATFGRTLRYGFLSAGAVWLFIVSMSTEELDLDVWLRTFASMPADPIATAAVALLVAAGTASLTGWMVLGRSQIASRLRYLGLL